MIIVMMAMMLRTTLALVLMKTLGRSGVSLTLQVPTI